MSSRDQLHAVIDRLPDDRVEELLDHAHRLEAEPPSAAKPPAADGLSLMQALLAIKIDGLPPDLSENLDDYLYGEKSRRGDVP